MMIKLAGGHKFFLIILICFIFLDMGFGPKKYAFYLIMHIYKMLPQVKRSNQNIPLMKFAIG